MEKMFLDATNKTEDSATNLHKMITDESAIFDILGDFFYHVDEAVCQAALEVYVRRAFISYDLTCLQHQRLPQGQTAVHFQFLLPQSHPSRFTFPRKISTNRKGFDQIILQYFNYLDHGCGF